MPAWLRQSANFCVVLRQPAPTGPGAVEIGLAGAAGKEEVLRATSVLDALILEFGLQPPALTQDPLGFFAQQLRQALWSDEGEEETADVYGIRALIERAGRAQDCEEQLRAKVNAELEAMREALRRSDYRSAVREALTISLASLDPQQLREVAISMSTASQSLLDDSPEELCSYDLTVEASDLLVGKPEMVSLKIVARALLFKAVTLGTLNRSEEAIAAYDEVLRRFSDAPQPALREQVARELRLKEARSK